ncbi:regulator of microtubule dynamics protein 1-like [Symsagittifera roscoffensis]|uniref:regulator of microtubule dynamics protein 1-like n=1 Tax=Symsagittifera roscoffensis TaxID=84072 RepID=UPI00307C4750
MSENSTAVAIKEADGYYDQNDFQKVYDTLVKHKSDTSNCELQWKIARAARDLSCLSSTSKERKKELTYEGLECAQNAVNSDDSNFSAHKWKGIMLSEVGDYEGIKKKIENGYLIRDEFTKASELNPNDALCYFLLGEWSYFVSDMGWTQRQAAKVFFGTPPSSSFEEALKNFLKAEEVNSGFYVGNYVSLGKTYLKLKKKEEAKKWFQKAAEYPSENEKDDQSIAEAKKLLATL